MVLDWLAAGLDPERSVIFVQSAVKEHAELHLLLSMLVSKARLERIPTLKEQIRDLHLDEQTISYGHLGYSVLQAADILLYRRRTCRWARTRCRTSSSRARSRAASTSSTARIASRCSPSPRSSSPRSRACAGSTATA